MNPLTTQLTKDSKILLQKFSGLKKISVKTWLVSSLFVFLTVGLLVALYASRLTTEDRSGATGGAPELYFSPASAVITRDAQQQLQPVQNIEVHVSAGRPIVSYSFVVRLTDSSGQPAATSEWSKLAFIPNGKLAENVSDFIGSRDRPTAKLFVGTIGQKEGGITRVQDTLNSGKLGSFTFTPSENQQDVRLSFFAVPGKAEANSLYVLGSLLSPPTDNGEVQIPQANLANVFNLHNPFNSGIEPTPTPVGYDIERSSFLYTTANGAEWQEVAGRFDSYNAGGTLKTQISADDVDQIWLNSSFAPAFRLRVKTAAGTYRKTTVNGAQTDVLVQGGSGTLAGGEFWANWKVTTDTAQKMYLTVPGTTDKLQIARGDTAEVTVNLKKVEDGVVYNCTENSQVVVYPLGQPDNQQVIGPCTNHSKATLSFDTPVPTDTPAPPSGDTYRVTIDYAIHPDFMTYFNNYCPNSGASHVSGVDFKLLDIPTNCIVNAQPKQISCSHYDSDDATPNGQIGTVTFDVLRSCSNLTGRVMAMVQSCDKPGYNLTGNLRDIVINRNITLSMSIGTDDYTSGICSGPTMTPVPR